MSGEIKLKTTDQELIGRITRRGASGQRLVLRILGEWRVAEWRTVQQAEIFGGEERTHLIATMNQIVFAK